MKETEVVKLFSIIRIEHPRFEITDEKRRLWYGLMKDVPFEEALHNLYDHLRTSDYPPKAANIIRRSPDTYGEHLLLENETDNRLKLMDQWERKAVDMPEAVRKRIEYSQRLLRQGEGHEREV